MQVEYQQLAMRGGAIIQNILNLDPITATDTGAHNLTPVGSLYLYNPSAIGTVTLQTGSASSGDIVILVNISSNAVTIADTGATPGGSTVVLGENDVAAFVYTGSLWACIFNSDNS